jgi:hypothetical protein
MCDSVRLLFFFFFSLSSAGQRVDRQTVCLSGGWCSGKGQGKVSPIPREKDYDRTTPGVPFWGKFTLSGCGCTCTKHLCWGCRAFVCDG